MLKTGKRENPEEDFICINPAILNKYVFFWLITYILNHLLYSRSLKICDVKGKVLLLLVPTMPDKLRLSLYNRLRSIFPEEFIHTNSSTGDGTFPCVHFTIYNRYSVQVCLFVFLFDSLTIYY
jgi:hypothetical protein